MDEYDFYTSNISFYDQNDSCVSVCFNNGVDMLMCLNEADDAFSFTLKVFSPSQVDGFFPMGESSFAITGSFNYDSYGNFQSLYVDGVGSVFNSFDFGGGGGDMNQMLQLIGSGVWGGG